MKGDSMNKIDFVKHINGLRKGSKGQWYSFVGTVDGKSVSIKGFGTWLQIYRVDGIDQNTTMDNSVSNFTIELQAGI